jgi:arsenate reductase
VADPVTPRNVLFLCTGNSARSIFAEVLLNEKGGGRFRAFSAGSFPKGQVHPMALDILDKLGFATAGLRSKSWDEFAAAGAPAIDFIITVCDDAANETCPVWPGHPTTVHWGIEDPAAVGVEGGAEGQREAFLKALNYLTRRIELFLALPLEALDDMALRSKLRQIGAEAGASAAAKAQV